ncbi:MAG: TRAP transporter TatT component family protein, partial [Pseudomonadota bacterium]
STLRGPGLGDDPDVARGHFDKAIALTDGQDLSVKVEYARSYARTYYERELHDRLLNEVLAADPVADGYTLTNTLAQRDAQALLDSADDYF